MANLAERSRLLLPAWVGRWFPTVVTIVSLLILAFSMVGGWPSLETPPGYVVGTGSIVAIEPETNAAGDTIALHVLYGFMDADGTRFFSEGIVGEGGILAGYGWESLSNSEPIKVTYNPLDPNESIPFRAFPFWALASWGSLVGTIAVSIALWIKYRLFPKPEVVNEVPVTSG